MPAMDVDTLWSSVALVLLQFIYVVTASRCTFPSEWRGTWYQNGLGELTITKHAVSHKGHCISSSGKKYLLFDRNNECFMCLVFTRQHDNLLQYKESFCDNDDNIDLVCGAITGDSQLHTIVKVSGQPVPCPFQGPYTFSYTNGSVETCDDPQSEIHACADKSRFIFNYKRCKHLPHTRDVQLSFQCMAMWFNGEEFLYGKFTSHGRPDRNRMYRCFMYSLYGKHGEMSMSQDATCQGLSSPDFGMNTFDLTHHKEDWPRPSCLFPDWLWRSGAWRDVAGRWRMTVAEKNDELSLHDLLHPDFLVPGEQSSETRLRARCFKVALDEPTKRSPSLRETHILTYATNDSCMSSYLCIRLKQRADQVFEMKIGAVTDDNYLGCEDNYFTNSETHVFFPHEDQSVPCPMNGSYSYEHTDGNCGGSLDVGCEYKSQMLVHAACPSRQHTAEIMQCIRTWTEDGKQYVIAGRPGNIYNPVGCLVFEEKGRVQKMVEATDCGAGKGLSIMDQNIDYTITSPRKECVPKEPSAPYLPVLPSGRQQDTRIHRNDVTSTSRPGAAGVGTRPQNAGDKSPTDFTKIHVINNSNTSRTCASYVVCLCALLTLWLNGWGRR